MLFENIAVLAPDFSVKENMFIGVKGDRIEYACETAPARDYGEKYIGKNKLLMSGLFNAHSHAAMTLLRGYAENLTLDRWLNERVFPFEAKLTGEDIYNGTMLGIAEMLRFGTVSYSDMYMQGEYMVKAAAESGIKSNISVSCVCFDGSSYYDLPCYAEFDSLFKNYRNSENGRIKIDLCVHGEYTSTERVVREAAAAALERGANAHIHLSETEKEHNDCKMRHKKTPAEYFLDCGLFESNATAAHCVYVEDNDIEILKAKNVSVAANPSSNMKLASGFLPLPKLLEKGVNVCIGTDGAASGNNLNGFRSLYLFSLLSKGAFRDPAAVTPAEALRAATINGAMAQGRADSGAIQQGMKADLIVLDVDKPHMRPKTDMVNNLVYAAEGSDVVMTMVDGKVLYKDGGYTTIDIEKVKYEAIKSSNRIIREL
ncbi:MAG: amidohydrolase [Oscillospiraceae bacterium]|nr:amidohydrolase [Oscillospiraceae bacterium]